MSFLSSAKAIRFLLTPVLILWVSGTGCLLGCGNMTMAGEHEASATISNLVVAGDACASGPKHDCCAHHSGKAANISKANKKSATAIDAIAMLMSETSSLMEDCPLAINASAALTKARPDAGPQVADAQPHDFSLRFEEHESVAPSPHLLPNRGHTYLRCCAFLI